MDEIKLLRSLVNHYLEKEKSISAACKVIQKRLRYEWSWRYLSQIYAGVFPLTRPKLKKAIIKLHRKTFTKYLRHRLYIQAESKEEKAGWIELTMQERRDALNEKRAEKRSIG